MALADLLATLDLTLPVAAVWDVLRGLVLTLFVLSSILVLLVVLGQEGKGGGLSGAFGGAGAETFGVKAGTVNKFTAWVATSFLGLALIYSGMKSASKLSVEAGSGPATTEFEGQEEPGAAATDPSGEAGTEDDGPLPGVDDESDGGDTDSGGTDGGDDDRDDSGDTEGDPADGDE